MFEHPIQVAEEWVDAAADELGTSDRRFAYRMLRAWLHTVRDQLPVPSSASFAAQLPELLRGVYYEGWEPAKVPHRTDVEALGERFADEAGIRLTEAADVATHVTEALRQRMSDGQVDKTLQMIPHRVRELLLDARV
jgi:uncharacterized protein (DUF2267 family)